MYYEDKMDIIQNMMRMFSKDIRSLLDLGFGTKESNAFLMNEVVEYWGVDYINSGKDAVIREFNQGDFPSVQADAVICMDCLEYIKDVDGFLKKMCDSSAREIVISYCAMETISDMDERKRRGFQNHMTIRELFGKMRRNGFLPDQMEELEPFTYVFKLINIRQYIMNIVRWKHLTYLGEDALKDLMEAASEANGREGCIIETGCALGGSGICMAHEKDRDKPMFIYDVFGMIPEPGENDGKDVLERYEEIKQGKSTGICGDTYYGYQENLLEKVSDAFCQVLGVERPEDINVHLIKGLFEDTLICKQPVALAHIDCDWYDSVMVCLERIVPMLTPGGVLVIDDYEHWSGCREAVEEYFKDKKEQFSFVKKSRLHIIKNSN